MRNLHLVFLVFAFVCEGLAAIGVGSPRINLTALGLAFFIASFFLV